MNLIHRMAGRLLISSVDRGQMEWNTESVSTLYECAQCGLCYANCVTGQPLPSAIAAARAHVVSLGAAPHSVLEIDARLRQWRNPYQDSEPVAATGTAPTALFVGAAAQYLHPETLVAARKLLDVLGIAYVPIAVGLSSAYLPFALGLRETAQTLAKALYRKLSPVNVRV